MLNHWWNSTLHLTARGLTTRLIPGDEGRSFAVELPEYIPFPDDTIHQSYDAQAVTTFWRILVEAQRVFDIHRARFVGKSSPVRFFRGPSTRPCRGSRVAMPRRTRGCAPNCGPHVMHEAYSHEVSSAGFWPGGEGGGKPWSAEEQRAAGRR